MLCIASVVTIAPPARAATPAVRWVRPVQGPIVRRFIAPVTIYGPGHRGVDIQSSDGVPVGAAASGRVLFAGLVAGHLHVTVRHPTSGWVTGYSNLASVAVRPGMQVRAGEMIGRIGGTLANHRRSTLHFSLRIAGQYRDPETLFGSGPRARVHLVPFGRAQPTARPFGLW